MFIIACPLRKINRRSEYMHDYKKMINEMLERIHEPDKLKRIYDYICFVYLKGA